MVPLQKELRYRLKLTALRKILNETQLPAKSAQEVMYYTVDKWNERGLVDEQLKLHLYKYIDCITII